MLDHRFLDECCSGDTVYARYNAVILYDRNSEALRDAAFSFHHCHVAKIHTVATFTSSVGIATTSNRTGTATIVLAVK